jgi:hypothetical protein
MTSMTTTTPTAIREYLTRQSTDRRKAKARIVEAYDPDLGWHTVDMPVTVGSAITLGRRGQTRLCVEYMPPAWTTANRGTPRRADFGIAECLS